MIAPARRMPARILAFMRCTIAADAVFIRNDVRRQIVPTYPVDCDRERAVGIRAVEGESVPSETSEVELQKCDRGLQGLDVRKGHETPAAFHTSAIAVERLLPADQPSGQSKRSRQNAKCPEPFVDGISIEVQQCPTMAAASPPSRNMRPPRT